MNLNELIKKQDELEMQMTARTKKLVAEGAIISWSVSCLMTLSTGSISLPFTRYSGSESPACPPQFHNRRHQSSGNVIPVVDVRGASGFPRAKVTDLRGIIVIETNDKLVGLMVDNVPEGRADHAEH